MNDNPAFERIQSEIDSAPVTLFMKGSPSFPQCGFSAAVVQALMLSGVEFKGVDVLQDGEIREGIKQFSNWPTIPQLYVKGEFVGGCDIIREMYESGELKQVFTDAGVETSVEDA
ncbi:MAG: Grx4 family monothiol glutaredoxin [Rhodospirillaceae bacterium]|jgi:monothiol glutaredoxin|nr:Grx4 family monothiol glutaredoxin [Rhodospirillaceae bacterium]MBT3883647.1 Grx4 family monothiol glutaredoxin [Rhodospirillaceae bacterium]MBT4117671.1 Grx4 family monothiol glutaredoxin [Rhodospirillaceae bacterium]MBT4672720.1 Grx4 family monothiol glutaredoxin [Rhodospirillaceae bacterium]MBT4719234.1 Grx4 family monothiol glutaredoxin [Rhodospirillaceae bacterium]